MGHEDLRVGELASTPAHLHPEVFVWWTPTASTTSMGSTSGCRSRSWRMRILRLKWRQTPEVQVEDPVPLFQKGRLGARRQEFWSQS